MFLVNVMSITLGDLEHVGLFLFEEYGSVWRAGMEEIKENAKAKPSQWIMSDFGFFVEEKHGFKR